AVICELIRGLARYERLERQCRIAPAAIRRHGFGRRPYFDTLICRRDGRAIGLALYFFTYSTFLGQPTLYLEDLFVLPEARGAGPAVARGARVHGHHLRESIAVALLDGHAELVPRLPGRDRRQPLPAAGVHQLVVDQAQLRHARLPRLGDGRARPDLWRRQLAFPPRVEHLPGHLDAAVHAHPLRTRALADDVDRRQREQ